MKPSSVILTVLVSTPRVALVRSLVVSEKTCECESCPCTTIISPPKKSLALKNKNIPTRPRIRSIRKRVSSASPSSIDLTDIPQSISERYHFITKKPNLQKRNRDENDEEETSSYNRALEEQLLEWDRENETRATAQMEQLTELPTNSDTSWGIGSSTTWKMVLATLAVLSIGSTLILSASPEWTGTMAMVPLLPTAVVTSIPPRAQVELYIQEEVIPVAYQTLRRMFIMELWRKFWKKSFRSMKRLYLVVFGHPYSVSLWTKLVPKFLRNGLKKMYVKSMERQIEKLIVGTWNWGRYIVGLDVEDDFDDIDIDGLDDEIDVRDEDVSDWFEGDELAPAI